MAEGKEGVHGDGQEPLVQNPEFQIRRPRPGPAATCVALGKSLHFPGFSVLLFQGTKWVKLVVFPTLFHCATALSSKLLLDIILTVFCVMRKLGLVPN